jgi:hypothetical protein
MDLAAGMPGRRPLFLLSLGPWRVLRLFSLPRRSSTRRRGLGYVLFVNRHPIALLTRRDNPQDVVWQWPL